ncbi:spore germination protein [Halalkalibacillus halophilus]|uniref:spore germination protein n=1 Tax=Halalkalibacillus halophilus TaxID=392827 RepID=UPI00040C4E83|nr:spore germination protein [Halalkalibacillus halophilus]
MPSIVGPLKLNSVSGGTVNFGDAFYIAPKSSSKSNTGAGSNNTGQFIQTNSMLSSSNPFDPDFKDQPITANK